MRRVRTALTSLLLCLGCSEASSGPRVAGANCENDADCLTGQCVQLGLMSWSDAGPLGCEPLPERVCSKPCESSADCRDVDGAHTSGSTCARTCDGGWCSGGARGD